MRELLILVMTAVIAAGSAQAKELSASKKMSETELDKISAGGTLYRQGDPSRTPVNLPPGWQKSAYRVGNTVVFPSSGIRLNYLR